MVSKFQILSFQMRETNNNHWRSEKKRLFQEFIQENLFNEFIWFILNASF